MKRALLVAFCLSLILPATPAPAKKHKKPKGLGPVVTATATGPAINVPGESSGASANCPSGLQAVGGGFSAPFTSTDALVVTESYRSSAAVWHVSATLVAGAGAATAYAYCRRSTLPVTDVAATRTLASGPGESTLVEANCAPRAVAISGGFQMTSGPVPGHLPIPEASIAGGPVAGATSTSAVRNWQVVAQNSNTGEQAITAHAYCAKRMKVRAFSQSQDPATVPLFGSLTETSVCPPPPRGTKKRRKAKKPVPLLSAGGFHSPFATGVLPVHADSRIAGNGFTDTVVNGGSGAGPMTTESQAICF